MRILTVTTLWPNSRQPVHGLFVRQRVMEMAKRADVTVIAPVPWAPAWLGRLFPRYAKYGGIVDESRDGHVVVHHPRYLTFPKIMKSLDPVFMAVAVLLRLRRLADAKAFDVVDGHWLYPDGTAALIVGRLLGVPTTVTVRGDDIRTFSRTFLRRIWIRWTVKNAAWLFAVAGDLKRWVVDVAGETGRIDVSHNGVDGERFLPMDKATCRQRLGLTEGGRVVVMVGRIESPKGQQIVVDAVTLLIEGGGDWRLLLVGPVDDAAYAEGVRRKAADSKSSGRIVLAGAVPHDELPVWFSAADIFAMASDNEGCPNVLLEAMACGLPVVTTCVGGVGELVSEGDACLFVARDSQAFAAAFTEMARRIDDGRIRRGAIHGKGRTWSIVADEVIRRMEMVTAGAGRRAT